VVTGPLTDALPDGPQGVTIVRSLPDFRARLASAAVSVSQAGYNTLIEAVKARTATVAVPFETDREKEQLMRALVFAGRGLVTLVRSNALEARVLARAIDATADTTPPAAAIDFNGREGSVAAMRTILGHG
jgi:predicted glycosyltransferase